MHRPKLSGKTIGLAIAVGIVASIATGLIGYNPPDADIKFDWLSANAALESNAYEDVLELGDEAGVHLVVHHPGNSERPFVHPRTPGAILLSLPLILLEFDQLFMISVGVTAAAGFVFLCFVRERLDTTVPWGVVVSLLIAAPVFFTVRFAGQGMLMALAVILAWVSYERKNDMAAGVLIALAATLKLFPLLLIVPWILSRRYKPAAFALGGFMLLNGSGLLLPGVGLGDSIRAMVHGGDVWFSMLSNGSTAAMLARLGVDQKSAGVIAVVAALVVGTLAMRSQAPRVLRDPTPWLVLGLLCMPVSWVSYDIVLVPAVLTAFAHQSGKSRYSAVLVLSVWIGVSIAFIAGSAPGTVIDSGLPAFATRLAILVGWFVAGISLQWRSELRTSADASQLAPISMPARDLS